MRLLDLSADFVRELFHYDPLTGILSRRIRRGAKSPAGQIVGFPNEDGYLVTHIGRGSYSVHRLAWLHATGAWPDDEIDHINGVRDDNRLTNLRQATHVENTRNTGIRPQNTSGYRGVHFNKRLGKWQAQIRVDRKPRHLGVFSEIELAAKAYDGAARQAFGEFARTNFPAGVH